MYERLDKCPVCNHTSFRNFIICKDHAVSQESFAIAECDKCHFKFTNPRPGADKLAGYYESEEYISHNNANNSLINQVYKVARLFTVRHKIALINKLFPSKGNLLDVGCGIGTFVSAAQKNSWKTTGIEPNEKARAEAQKNISITFHANLDELRQNQSFDIITLWHVLEHVPDLNETIARLKKLLAAKGKLIIAVPNCDSLDATLYKHHWAAYDVPRHLYHFTQSTLKKLLAKHQLKLKSIQPMKLDAFYVCFLSEKYSNNLINNSFNTKIYLNAVKNGIKSNQWAQINLNNYSSLIYIIAK